MTRRYQMFACLRFRWNDQERRTSTPREQSFYGAIDFTPGPFGMTYSDLYEKAETHIRQFARLPADAVVIDWKIEPNHLHLSDYAVPSVDNNEWTF